MTNVFDTGYSAPQATLSHPAGPSEYFENYEENRTRLDDEHARRRAQDRITYGTPLEAGSARLGLTLMSASEGLYPGVGEYQDYQLLTDSKASTWQRTIAGGSLLLSVVTAGESPNAGSALRSTRVATHTAEELVTAQRLTRRIDVVPNSQFYTQIDTFGSSSAQLGRQGETIASQITGAAKNNQKFKVKGRNRIPDQVLSQDILTRLPNHIAEVKNTLYQAYTRQLKDFRDLVGQYGQVDLFLPPNARVSKPLQQAFEDIRNPITRRDLIQP